MPDSKQSIPFLPVGKHAHDHPSNRGGWDWPVVWGLGILHLVALAAPWTFSWSGLGIMFVLWYITGGIGITLAYHRLLTHRSFNCPKWLEFVITSCACLAWQGKPTQWVGTHRLHHKHSDTDHDPHTPTHGFTWAHVTWTLMKEPDGMKAEDAAKDLLRHPHIAFLDRHFVWPQVIVSILLAAAGYLVGYFTADLATTTAAAAGTKLALSWFVWGTAVRTIFVWHVTWFVNSATHTWGYRNFTTKEHSTNLWWVALLSFGEGWHNNHHAQQRSAAHGMRWFEIDITYMAIKVLEKLGLAWDVVEPKVELMDKNKEEAPVKVVVKDIKPPVPGSGRKPEVVAGAN